jgi:predicted secreted protein
MRRLLAFAVVLAALATSALAAASPAPRVLRLADSGKTVTIAQGQEVRVKLTECPSCGDRWKTVLRPNSVVLVRLPQIYGGSSCQQPCTGGTRQSTFRWRGRTAGITKLRIAYVLRDGMTSKTFRLTVRVRGRG